MCKSETVLEFYARVKNLFERAEAAITDKFRADLVLNMLELLDGITLAAFKNGLTSNPTEPMVQFREQLSWRRENSPRGYEERVRYNTYNQPRGTEYKADSQKCPERRLSLNPNNQYNRTRRTPQEHYQPSVPYSNN